MQDQRIHQPISGGAYLLCIWKKCGRVLEATATGGSGTQVVTGQWRQVERPANDD